uniref:Uncharacterized protein n=1 Tax=viral metagenome TaxID=1070528 RepID=A0A6M3KPJ6_9ZZZZ
MGDFTVEEIIALKKQAILSDKYDERNTLQDQKTAEILAVKQTASQKIDAINAIYNPQIEIINSSIEQIKNA